MPLLVIVTEGGLAVVSLDDWGIDDVALHTCGPAELEARMRLAIGRIAAEREAADPEAHVIRTGEVLVDEATYTAKISGRTLDLTFKELELLKFLAQDPGRVFSRSSSCTRSGVTTTSAVPAPSTYTCGGCGRSRGPRTRP